MLASKTADPSDVRKLTFDWSEFLTELAAGTTISASAWAIDPEGTATLTDATNDTTTTTVTVTFGTANKRYTISNLMTASNGEIAERSITVSVIQR